MSLPVIPPAIWRQPLCSVCEGELVDNGDFWCCEDCALAWDLEDALANGQPDTSEYDENEPRCDKEHVHRFFPAAIYRCIRPRGHSFDDGSPTWCAGLKFTDVPRGVASMTWRPDECRKPAEGGEPR